jgi:hypothetical protein
MLDYPKQLEDHIEKLQQQLSLSQRQCEYWKSMVTRLFAISITYEIVKDHSVVVVTETHMTTHIASILDYVANIDHTKIEFIVIRRSNGDCLKWTVALKQMPITAVTQWRLFVTCGESGPTKCDENLVWDSFEKMSDAVNGYIYSKKWL